MSPFRLLAALAALSASAPVAAQTALVEGTSLDGSPVLEARLTTTDRLETDRFGGGVALFGDRALVGAPFEDGELGDELGAAYIYVRQGTTWVQEARLVAGEQMENGAFGVSVALDGNRALVGAPGEIDSDGAAYVFVRSGSTWTQEARLDAEGASEIGQFGGSVSLSGDRALVGAPEGDDAVGTAYVFVRMGTTWVQDTRLVADDGVAGDLFGGSVSLSGDRALVGALGVDRNAGAAYIFTRSGASWVQEARLTNGDGPGDSGGTFFGFTVSLSGDDALVGEYGSDNFRGAAFVFTRTGAAWAPQARLTASDAGANSFFGDAVSLSGDQAIIGSTGVGGSRGAAYLFSRSGTEWTEDARIPAPASEAQDIFGTSVSHSDGRALVGAPGDDSVRGAAYVFSGVGAVAIEASPLAGGALSAMAPNPSSGRASLVLRVSIPQHVRVVVVDALGREVAVVLDGDVSGTTRLDVDTSRLPAGAYVVRVTSGGATASRMLTVVR